MRKTIKNGYSETELSDFAKLIHNKLSSAKNELLLMKETLDKTAVDEVRPNVKLFEESSEESEKENMSKLATRQNEFIFKLEKALIRIKNGTYGVCMMTGELINKARLKVVPHTTLSINAKRSRGY